MPYSILTYPGDGVTTTWPINFTLGFISRGDVKCRVGAEVDGLNQPVYRTLTWISDGLVEVQGTPAAIGQNVVFTRTLPKDSLIHDYQDGAPITESNLDDSNKQLIMLLHEIIDGRLQVSPTAPVSMSNQRIINVADGVAPTDAVTVQQAAQAIALTPYAVQAAADAAAALADAEDAAEAAAVSSTTATSAASTATSAASTATAQALLADAAADRAEVAAETIPDDYLPNNGVVSQTGAIMTHDTLLISTAATGLQCVFYGDSLTNNPSGTNPPSYYVTMPTWNGRSFTKNTSGHPGQTALWLAQSAWQYLNPYFATFEDMNIVFFHAGVNDIATGATAAEAYSRYAAACAHFRSLGWKVIATTLFSCNGYNTQRNAFNTYVKANWRKFADGLTDLAANATLGPDAAYTNTTYFNADGVHLTNAGNAIVGAEMQAAVTTFLNTYAVTPGYETSGSFTPTAIGSTTAGVGTYTQQVGNYKKVGSILTFALQIGWSAHTGTGNLYITGLPYVSATPTIVPCNVTTNGLAIGTGLLLQTGLVTGTSQVSLYTVNPVTGTLGFVPVDSDVPGIFISGTYFV